MPNAVLSYVFHHPSAFTSPFWGNLSFSRAFPQTVAVKPAEHAIRVLPLSFLMPLSKCYCNYRMGIQDFRPIYSSVFTRFGWSFHENQPAEPEVCTATSCLASLFSLPLSFWDDLGNRSVLCRNLNFYSALSIPTSAFNTVGLSGLEPLTPALSAQCSNRLSYRPRINAEVGMRSAELIPHSSFQIPHSKQRHIHR